MPSGSVCTTRFAPSPTGDLHLGSAWTALAAWAYARAHGGRALLRIEDIDTPRVVVGSAERVASDLVWLGLTWDGETTVQSARGAIYEAALAHLHAKGLTYLCDCSRAEIARAASAPHHGEESPETIYPGTCREAPVDRVLKRPPALRLRVPARSHVTFDDQVHGHVDEDVNATVGDFVLRRGDGVFAYQLVVAIDDADARVSHVIRADDLLTSTTRQILLMRLLEYASVPSYAHVPLVVAPDGQRLAKRTRGATVRELAERGVASEVIIATLARGLGLTVRPGPLSAVDVANGLLPPHTWRREPWPMPAEWQRDDA